MTTRRQFLNTAAVASGSALVAQSALPDLAWGATPSPMNILILGGTGYIGPHLVRLAVSRGHKVTTFTRGRRKPELPPGVIRAHRRSQRATASTRGQDVGRGDRRLSHQS